MTQPRRRRPGRIRPRPATEPIPTPERPRRQWLNETWSGFVGGLAAAAIGYVAVIQTINAEDERSATEFMREKQQEAYAELLTDERALRRLADEYMLSLAARAPAEKLAEQKQGIDAAYLELSQAANNVAIIGSPWAMAAALRIDVIHISVKGIVAATALVSQRQPLSDSYEQKFNEEYESLSTELDDVQLKFVQNARTDLGSSEPR